MNGAYAAAKPRCVKNNALHNIIVDFVPRFVSMLGFEAVMIARILGRIKTKEIVFVFNNSDCTVSHVSVLIDFHKRFEMVIFFSILLKWAEKL
jgi:hypothetical protein